MNRLKVDPTGSRFNRLTVMDRTTRRGRKAWRCKCDCGGEVVACYADLKSGHTSSCGCIKREKDKELGDRHATHRLTKTRVYKIWKGIAARCLNRKSPGYRNYGGRGIGVCKSWRRFENFLADMGEPPTVKHSIDRIDNDKGYSKENCRWATAIEQARNKRNTCWVFHRGQKMALRQYAEEVGVSYNRAYSLYKKAKTK